MIIAYETLNPHIPVNQTVPVLSLEQLKMLFSKSWVSDISHQGLLRSSEMITAYQTNVVLNNHHSLRENRIKTYIHNVMTDQVYLTSTCLGQCFESQNCLRMSGWTSTSAQELRVNHCQTHEKGAVINPSASLKLPSCIHNIWIISKSKNTARMNLGLKTCSRQWYGTTTKLQTNVYRYIRNLKSKFYFSLTWRSLRLF